MKTLKKHFVIIASISLLLLAGCSDGSSSGSGEGKGSGGNTVTDIKQSNKVLSFAKLTACMTDITPSIVPSVSITRTSGTRILWFLR